MSKKFTKPEAGYAGLSDEDLEAAENAALDEYAELSAIDDADITDEQLERMEELKAEIVEARAEGVARDEAAEARAQRIAAAKAGVKPEEGDEDEEEEEPEEGTESEESEESEEKEKALVASATKRPVVRRAAGKAKTPAVPAAEPEPAKLKITVAPDVRGYSSGAELSGLRGLTDAFQSRIKSFKSSPSGTKGTTGISTFGVATLERPLQNAETAQILEGDDGSTVYQKLMGLALQARNARGAEGVDSLVAAAYNGWVTPSENLYDICRWATFSGELQLPGITVRRGGINRTKGIDFSVIFNDTDGHFEYTESQMEARPTKPFRMLEVPEWEEFRLDSIGWGARAPIPLRNSFPELIDDYLEKSLVAYQHYRNASVINRVLDLIGGGSAPTPVNVPEYGGAVADTLQTLEMIRHQFIQKYSLADTQVLEATFPSWYRTVLKADLSRRNGYDNPFAVTDAQLDSWFRARGYRTQYIRDWEGQDLDGDVKNIALPTSAQFMVWVPGTYVRGGDEIISLDAIYDQQNLEKNEYIAAFFEESLLVADTCGEGELYEIGLDPYGLTGAAILGAPTS